MSRSCGSTVSIATDEIVNTPKNKENVEISNDVCQGFCYNKVEYEVQHGEAVFLQEGRHQEGRMCRDANR